jgi:hypothetical protein
MMQADVHSIVVIMRITHAVDRLMAITLDTQAIETYRATSMNAFKRNQVEEAISRTLGERSAQPSLELRTQLKRLLDTDRTITNKERKEGANVINFAFYSGDSPGKGADIWFSGYEAFALQTGWRILQHAWPQSFVVNALRHISSDFERQHSRIMKQDPATLFDKAAIEKQARPGDIAVDNTDPVFLTIVSGKAKFDDGISDQTSVQICRGMQEVSKFLKQKNAHSWTLFELVTYAHQLAEQLAAVQPRSRGRS